MASNTPNLNLYKKDPTVDGNDTFNIKTMLNDNWDKIDTAMITKVDKVDFSSHLADNMKHITSTERDTWNNKLDKIGGTLTGRTTITRVAETNNAWQYANEIIETTSTSSSTEMPRVALHSNGAGVCKQIAGDHIRGGVSVLSEDGNSLTDFNCREIRITNPITAPSNTSYTTRQVHNMILSPNDADVNAMQNGDVWCKYK